MTRPVKSVGYQRCSAASRSTRNVRLEIFTHLFRRPMTWGFSQSFFVTLSTYFKRWLLWN